MSTETLSRREREVVAELTRGGRVPTIAQRLSISPTTVRNHLQRIFWKLGVHSQAELVEYVRAHPEALSGGADAADARATTPAEDRYWAVNARLGAELDAIVKEQWGPEVVREVLHRALPLSDEGREEWRARLAVWSEEPAPDSDLSARRAAEMESWRGQALERIERAQDDGWVRSDLTAATILEQLFSLLVGVSMQMVTDPGSSRLELVRVVDAYIDDLQTGPTRGDWHA